MPEYTTIFAALGLLIVLLGIVLTIDFFFRQDVYDRSDPLSFAILLYSFLLVATDTGLNIMSQITAKDVNVPLIISGACYLAVVYVVFQFAKFAHKKFKKAQVDKIKKYLKSIRASSSAPDAVWSALIELGTSSIEPDAFVQNKAKRERRIEFLGTVRDLTGVSIEPEKDQDKLLVTETGVRRRAQIGYIVAFWFGLLSTLLFFFFFRLR